MVEDFDGKGTHPEDVERAVGMKLASPFTGLETFRDLVDTHSLNTATLRNADSVNRAGVYAWRVIIHNHAATEALEQALRAAAGNGVDTHHFINAANVLFRVWEAGGNCLLYIGCTANFATRYAAQYSNNGSNVRLYRFMRDYAVAHPDDFTFDYKILATCSSEDVLDVERWVGECAGLDAEWDSLPFHTGKRLVLNRQMLG